MKKSKKTLFFLGILFFLFSFPTIVLGEDPEICAKKCYVGIYSSEQVEECKKNCIPTISNSVIGADQQLAGTILGELVDTGLCTGKLTESTCNQTEGKCTWSFFTCVRTADYCGTFDTEAKCNELTNCYWSSAGVCKANITVPPPTNNDPPEESEKPSNSPSTAPEKCEERSIDQCSLVINGVSCRTTVDGCVSTASSHKKTCSEYSEKKCPDEDERGNACTVKNKKCIVDTSSGDDKLYNTISCGSVEFPEGLPQFTRNLINAIKVLIPVILILLGIFDFVRAVIANDEKNMKAAQSRFIRRIIAGLAVFFVVAIVQFIFSMIKTNDNLLGCVKCFVSSKSACRNEDYSIKYACSDYKKEAACKPYDDYNNLCEWSKSKEKCIRKKKAQGCNDFSWSNCPEVDDFGDHCRKVGTEANGYCDVTASGKECHDYSYDDCPSVDSKKNACKKVGTSQNGYCDFAGYNNKVE